MSSDPPPIPVSLDRAYHAVNELVARRLAEDGYPDIRPAHAKVFEQIGPGRRVREMAERAQVTKQSMGELVAYLEGRGYVERAPDPADGRAKIVRATAKGRECVTDAWRILDSIAQEWARALGRARLDNLQAMLAELTEAMPPGER